MNIVEKHITDIRPYEKNPRKNDDAVKYVAASIKQFGWKVPIVIDKDGVIVAGHTRYKAALELNIKEVPCVIADDLTPEQIKAYRLADNKVAEKAFWDFDLLDEELDGIFDLDMSEFGFMEDLDEVGESGKTSDYIENFFEEGAMPAAPKEPEYAPFSQPCTVTVEITTEKAYNVVMAAIEKSGAPYEVTSHGE